MSMTRMVVSGVVIISLTLTVVSWAAPAPKETILPTKASDSVLPPSAPSSSFDIFMPGVQPKQPDTYLCTAVKIDEHHRYLTAFEPKANSHDAHHLLLYGCEEPGMKPGNVWNCGEMSSSSDVASGSVCASGSSILYAWAMDAPKLNLPTDVGFDVGQATPIKYLVLQVHYKNVSKFVAPENGKDDSGLTIVTSPTRTPKQAGVYLMVTGGYIPSHTTEYFEAACEYGEDQEIIPFAYRTHAHSLGRVISGYRVRDGEWSEIGRKDPRLPEMFYNVTNPGVTVKKGDILAARCTMQNTKDHDVAIGNTQNDEMCNFYVMYYVEGGEKPSTQNCVTQGPPSWYFKDFEDQAKLNLGALPKTASTIPGKEESLVQNATQPMPAYAAAKRFVDPPTEEIVWMGEQDPQRVMPDTYMDSYGIPDQQLDQAIEDMTPDELLYLIQQLAKAEEDDEMARKQYWIQQQQQQQQQQRQRMMQQNRMMRGAPPNYYYNPRMNPYQI